MGAGGEGSTLGPFPNPRELALGLASGSPEAARVVRARVRKILGFRGYLLPAEERRDLEQEVMTQIWQAVNRTGFDADAGFLGFVEVVTVRRCIDSLRRQRPTSELDEGIAAVEAGPLDDVLDRERLQLVSEAVARLDEPCRELLRLHFGLGMPYGELAARFGKSRGALRVQVFRCIRRARSIVEELSSHASTDDSAVDGG